MAISNVVRFSIRKLAKKRAKRRKKTKFTYMKDELEKQYKTIHKKKKTIKAYDELIKTKSHDKSKYENLRRVVKGDLEDARKMIEVHLPTTAKIEKKNRPIVKAREKADKAYEIHVKEIRRKAKKRARELAKLRAEEGYGKLLKFGKKKK